MGMKSHENPRGVSNGVPSISLSTSRRQRAALRFFFISGLSASSIFLLDSLQLSASSSAFLNGDASRVSRESRERINVASNDNKVKIDSNANIHGFSK